MHTHTHTRTAIDWIWIRYSSCTLFLQIQIGACARARERMATVQLNNWMNCNLLSVAILHSICKLIRKSSSGSFKLQCKYSIRIAIFFGSCQQLCTQTFHFAVEPLAFCVWLFFFLWIFYMSLTLAKSIINV